MDFKSSSIIAAWRTLETSVLASVVVFITLLIGFIQTHGFTGFDWKNGLTALAVGITIGVGNGIVTIINLLIQQLKGQ